MFAGAIFFLQFSLLHGRKEIMPANFRRTVKFEIIESRKISRWSRYPHSAPTPLPH